MKRIVLMQVVTALILAAAITAEAPPMINYQGYLTDAGGAALDTTVSMEFAIYDDSTGGVLKWAEAHTSVMVEGGAFSVILGTTVPIDDSVFNQPDRWLGITVGSDPELSPRTHLGSVGYAHRVSTVDGSAGGTIDGTTYIGRVMIWIPSGCLNGGGDCEPNVECPQQTLITGTLPLDPPECGRIWVTDGLEPRVDLDGGTGDVSACGKALFGERHSNLGMWSFVAGCDNTVNVDYSTVSGGQYNNSAGVYSNVGGGSNNTASGVASAVGGGESNIASGDSATVGGGSNNTASSVASTVGGGYTNTASGYVAMVGGGLSNTASGEYTTIGGGGSNTAYGPRSTVSGGENNCASGSASTVGGGQGDTASGARSTVGGGYLNTASGYVAVVGGGISNTASGVASTVGGGKSNTANGDSATVGGGSNNTASGVAGTVGGGHLNTANGDSATVGGGHNNIAYGRAATIPGGTNNLASGNYSFAAGRRAKANHNGTFVWADNLNADFSSSANAQFLVRAWGGVGINCNDPTEDLDVEGTARLRTMPTGGGTNVVVTATGVLSRDGSSRRYKKNIRELDVDPNQAFQLLPVRFQWKESGAEDVGLIAEDVAHVIPELVVYDSDGRPDGVRYDKVALYLMGTVKDQSRLIEELKTELSQLRQQNTTEIQTLKEETAQLKALLETVLAGQVGSTGGSNELAIGK